MKQNSNTMTTTNTYPENFYYKESCFEGTHTSYWWHHSEGRKQIVGETKAFYLVSDKYFSGVAWKWSEPKKVKKTNISFNQPEDF